MKRPPIQQIKQLAREAGAAIMAELKDDLVVHMKDEGTGYESPYTEADLAADRIVRGGLAALTPDIPVLSEEDAKDAQQAALQSKTRWVVDPLDGSRTSIAYANGEKTHTGFGVHIALIEDGVPVAGVVFFPAQGEGGTMFFTGDNGRAYRQEGDNPPCEIHASKRPGNPLTAAVSWSEKERPEQIAGRDVEYAPQVGGGRICSAASGAADVAWIERPFSHWDVAAAHAVLRAAGGDLVEKETGASVTYENKELSIPPSVGGSHETLRMLGFTQTMGRSNRGVGG